MSQQNIILPILNSNIRPYYPSSKCSINVNSIYNSDAICLEVKWYLMYKVQQALKDPKYKTELCKSYISQGFCKYDKKCRFAHGLDDLMTNLKKNPTQHKSNLVETETSFNSCSTHRTDKDSENKFDESILQESCEMISSDLLKVSCSLGFNFGYLYLSKINKRLDVFEDITSGVLSSVCAYGEEDQSKKILK